MTRLEVESEIVKHLVAIKQIYKKYNPEGYYLNLVITDKNVVQ